jgi:hypothetical protein
MFDGLHHMGDPVVAARHVVNAGGVARSRRTGAMPGNILREARP